MSIGGEDRVDDDYTMQRYARFRSRAMPDDEVKQDDDKNTYHCFQDLGIIMRYQYGPPATLKSVSGIYCSTYRYALRGHQAGYFIILWLKDTEECDFHKRREG